MPPPANPLTGLHLFGLSDRKLDLALSLLLIGLLAVSRLAAFPASIWEQDEAIFSAAVVDLDPTDNRPHPPWFPLWIAMGKLVHLTGVDPSRALQLVSLAFAIWIVIPLTGLWSRMLPRPLAPAAAVLFAVAPGPWLFSGRAFCGTAATALLVASLALWIANDGRGRRVAAGSLMAGLAVLVRPQLLLPAAGAAVVLARRVRSGQRRWLVLPAAAVTTGAAIVLVVVGGGIGPMATAFAAHAGYHLSRLPGVDLDLPAWGCVRSLGHPAVALVWLALTAAGVVRLVRLGRFRDASPILIGAVLPLLVEIHLLSNPHHARYAVPVLALTSGFVVLGLATVARRRTWPAVLVIAAVATAAVAPQLARYRSAVSPPLAALEAASAEAGRFNGVVIADRTLHAFVELRRLTRPPGPPVLYDSTVELGVDPGVPPARAVYVFDAVDDRRFAGVEPLLVFRCTIPLVRRLAQDRYTDIIVGFGTTSRDAPRGPDH